MICIFCGCSDLEPCVDPATGGRCAWAEIDSADEGLCSFCAEKAGKADEPLVALVSDAEATAFLRTRRAAE